jgi:hypothetical protein
MLNRLRTLLIKAVDVTAVILAICVVMVHIVFAGIITTAVVNAWRLDSYIDPITGVGMVLLLFMVVWLPLWMIKRSGRR